MPLLPVLSSTISSTTSATVSTTAVSTTTDSLLKLCILWSVLNKPELQGFGDNPDFPEIPTPPLICMDYLGYPGYPGSSYSNVSPLGNGTDDIALMRERKKTIMSRLDPARYTSRSYVVIGALAGIVFILLIMAITTCIRHRRELYLSSDSVTSDRHITRQVLMNQLRHIRSGGSSRQSSPPRDPPPSYDDVVKQGTSRECCENTIAFAVNEGASTSSGVLVGDECCGPAPPSYLEAMASMTSASDDVTPSFEDSLKHETTIQIH